MDGQLQNRDILLTLFGAGYLIHLTCKSTLYPTVSNLPLLISTATSLFCALAIFSFYKLNFQIVPSLIFTAYSSSFLIGGFLISLSVNRLFLHPLRVYPGPLFARFSKLWGVWNALDGKYYRRISNLFEEYDSDYIRVGPNEIVTRDVGAAKMILGQNGWEKAPRYDIGGTVNGYCSLTNLRPNDAHNKRRKIWDQAFTPSSLYDYNDLLKIRILNLLSSLEDHAKDRSEQDIGDWIGYFVFDFMGDVAFGGMFELTKEGSDKNGYWRGLTNWMKINGLLSHIPELDEIVRFFLRAGPFGKQVHRFRAFAQQRMEVRKARGALNNRKDLFYWLFGEDAAGKSKDNRLNKWELMADSSLVIVAGTDTTSNTLTIFFFMLLSRPEILAKVQEEVDEAFKSTDEEVLPVEYWMQGKLKYLEACINETMRMFPLVPGGSLRWSGEEGKDLAGRYIPPRTTVSVSMYSVHRDPRNFGPDSNTFRPERWLSGETYDKDAFTPFSMGPRNCVGKNLAMMEMRAVVTSLLRKFRFRFVDGFDRQKWEDGLKAYFLLDKAPLPVLVRERI